MRKFTRLFWIKEWFGVSCLSSTRWCCVHSAIPPSILLVASYQIHLVFQWQIGSKLRGSENTKDNNKLEDVFMLVFLFLFTHYKQGSMYCSYAETWLWPSTFCFSQIRESVRCVYDFMKHWQFLFEAVLGRTSSPYFRHSIDFRTLGVSLLCLQIQPLS